MDERTCARCGTSFEPRREHARFCSARCRVAWNRENTSYRTAEYSALAWSVIAMRDTIERLNEVSAADRPRGFMVISEAVWWVTIVDATLVRYHPEAYDAAMAAQPADVRRLTEGTFAGLRFVRNRMGYHADPADFIAPRRGEQAPVAAWTWKQLSEPTLESLPARAQAWELDRYLAYQRRLAGHTIGETFARAADFLELAVAPAQAPGRADAR